LICGSSDGYISIHEYKNDNWSASKILAHGFGVNGLSWAPVITNESDLNSLNVTNVVAPLRFVSCGMDNLVRVWQAKDNKTSSFHVIATLEAHEDIVRDVAWRTNTFSNYDTIASGGDVFKNILISYLG
jgi:protein transport protein SEC13